MAFFKEMTVLVARHKLTAQHTCGNISAALCGVGEAMFSAIAYQLLVMETYAAQKLFEGFNWDAQTLLRMNNIYRNGG